MVENWLSFSLVENPRRLVHYIRIRTSTYVCKLSQFMHLSQHLGPVTSTPPCPPPTSRGQHQSQLHSCYLSPPFYIHTATKVQADAGRIRLDALPRYNTQPIDPSVNPRSHLAGVGSNVSS
jgi:hypothetical protein